MTKRDRIIFIVGILISIGLSVAIILMNVIPQMTIKSSEEIYTDALQNVVEVKATLGEESESFGTGVIVDNVGTIITNAHVITYKQGGEYREFTEYYIRYAYEEEYRKVELEKYDLDLDIAVLRLNDETAKRTTPAKIGNSDKLVAGQKVFAVGNASNYGIGIFEGIVSVPKLNVKLDEQMRLVIQSDITISSGNSGGALLDERGQLIGITTFRTKDTLGNVVYGIAYSIPINNVLAYVNSSN